MPFGILDNKMWTVSNITTQRGKAIELWDNLDAFVNKFNWDFLIKIFVEQGLVSVSIFIVQVVWFIVLAIIANNIKSIYTGISNIQDRLSVMHSLYSCIKNLISKNEKTVIEKRELVDLMSIFWRKKLKLHKSSVEGICINILQTIETKVKNTSGHNMIWIRGSPGVGKSALAASILT